MAYYNATYSRDHTGSWSHWAKILFEK